MSNVKIRFLLLPCVIIVVAIVINTKSYSAYEHVCPTKQVVNLKSRTIKNRIVNKVDPIYPPACKCKGKVTAYLRVNKEGMVEKVTTSKGHPLLRVAVAQAIRQWTFEPLKKHGNKICFSGKIDFVFSESGFIY